MRTAFRLAVVLSLPLLAATAGAQSRGQAVAPSAIRTSQESDFVKGRSVYLRSSGTLIGTIIAEDASYAFPSSFAKGRMKAVLIRRKDGPESWTPVQGLARIYYVDKD